MIGITKNLGLLVILPVALISFFLNYISSSYSEVDLFNLDLSRKDKTTQKLIFILKNSHLLFTIVCFSQIILSTLISAVLVENLDFTTIQDKSGLSQRWILIGGAFLTALFTELLSRFLASRKNNRKFASKPLLINLTYLILRPFSFLKIVIRPKKRLFSDSEEDLIRFFNNLKAERVLEKKEVDLVQSALLFDELTINHLIVPRKKVIFLQETMSLEEIKVIYSKHSFTRYPVLDKKKEKVVGILSMKRLFWTLTKEKEKEWRTQIDKKILFLTPSTKLNKAFERTQSFHCRMILVKTFQKKSVESKNKFTTSFLGIVTLHDILNSLVGKLSNNVEKTLPFSPPKSSSLVNSGSEDSPTNS